MVSGLCVSVVELVLLGRTVAFIITCFDPWVVMLGCDLAIGAASTPSDCAVHRLQGHREHPFLGRCLQAGRLDVRGFGDALFDSQVVFDSHV